MRCACDPATTKQTQKPHVLRRTVEGRTFIAEAMVDACEGCGELFIPAWLTIAFERAVAIELARRGPISGVTFRRIRRAAKLEREDIVHMLGASPETVTSWEDGRRHNDAAFTAAWMLIAALALDMYEGPRPLRSRMALVRKSVDEKTEKGGTAGSASASASAGGARAANGASEKTALGSHQDEDIAGSETILFLDNAKRIAPRTLASVIELLTGPIAFADVDIADALAIDIGALRKELGQLADRALVRAIPMTARHPEAIRWEPLIRDRDTLLAELKDEGIDLETPLPNAKPIFAPGNVIRRVTPVSWAPPPPVNPSSSASSSSTDRQVASERSS